jgi:hypothetical protein
MGFFGWRPYVSVAERRRKAERELQKLRKKGHPVAPVVIDGRTIARTFWGKAWCENLEHYSDYANRLPRGRTYVRNGSVVDLQIAAGEVSALVSGSDIYRVAVKIAAVPKAHWTAIRADCAGAIDSLVELLQGRFSRAIMERISQPKTGLFPAPAEIKFSCSCPDWASMCKHVAAVLYGIGARLDAQPELLFRLRRIDERELIAEAGRGLPLSRQGPSPERVLAGDDLSALFGLDLGGVEEPARPVRAGRATAPVGARRARKAAIGSAEAAAAKTKVARTAGAAKAAVGTTRAAGTKAEPRKASSAKAAPRKTSTAPSATAAPVGKAAARPARAARAGAPLTKPGRSAGAAKAGGAVKPAKAARGASAVKAGASRSSARTAKKVPAARARPKPAAGPRKR